MTYLFSRSNRYLLETFAWSNVLLAFDYDGTLAPLVSLPARATMRPSTRHLLKRVSRLYPCVSISGRAQADAFRRLKGVEICRVIGNHGVEPSAGSAALRRRVQRWLPILNAQLERWPGVVIEAKGYSVAIHYRQARDRNATRNAILSAAQLLDEVQIIGGKLAINLLVLGSPHKGLALERERARFACDAILYVGDDETDEDAFRLDRPGRQLSIRVGRKRSSAAPFYIRNQAEIDRLLAMLVALRQDREVLTSAALMPRRPRPWRRAAGGGSPP